MHADKAKKYLNLKEELKNIEIGLFVYNIEKYKQTLQELTQDEEIMKSTLNQEEGKLEKIKVNKIKCKKCGDIIESTRTHDFKTCKCGAVSVDGGKDYLRRVGNPKDIEELVEYE